MPNFPRFLMLQKAYVEIKYLINLINRFFQYLVWLTGVNIWLNVVEKVRTIGIMKDVIILLNS